MRHIAVSRAQYHGRGPHTPPVGPTPLKGLPAAKRQVLKRGKEEEGEGRACMQLSSLDKAQKEEDHEQQQEKRSREEGQKQRATNQTNQWRCPAASACALTALMACTASIGYSTGGRRGYRLICKYNYSEMDEMLLYLHI